MGPVPPSFMRAQPGFQALQASRPPGPPLSSVRVQSLWGEDILACVSRGALLHGKEAAPRGPPPLHQRVTREQGRLCMAEKSRGFSHGPAGPCSPIFPAPAPRPPVRDGGVGAPTLGALPAVPWARSRGRKCGCCSALCWQTLLSAAQRDNQPP